MRILMLTDSMGQGGAQTHICTLAAELCRRGHFVLVASEGGESERELLRCGAHTLHLPLANKSPLSVAACIFAVSVLAKRGRFDVIHAHARVAAFVGERAARYGRIAFVSTVHAQFRQTGLRSRLCSWGDTPIAVSEDIRSYIVKSAQIPPEQITVIPNAVDTNRFYPREKPKKQGVHIGCLSRLDADSSKTAELLCCIAPRLCRVRSGIHINIGGDGSQYGRVRQLAERVNKICGYECVRLHGAVRDVPHFLLEQDIYVGVARTVIEAALCGISSIICGDGGFFGRLTEDNFSAALAENFTARGEREADTADLFYELERVLCMSGESLCDEVVRVGKCMSEACSVERAADQTEGVYLKARKNAVRTYRRSQGRVLLCGYYGYGNMGDEALRIGAAERAKFEYPSHKIYMLMRHSKRSADGVQQIGRLCLPKLIYTACRADCTVLGGGTLLQDETSLRSLLYYSAVCLLTHAHGGEVKIWGGGIGELRTALGRAVCRRVLCGCSHIGLRDMQSLGRAEKLIGSASKKIVLESDLAALCATDTSRAKYLLRTLSLEGERFFAVMPNGRETADCRRRLFCAVVRLAQRGYKILFIPMHKGEDRKICTRLCRKTGTAVLENISCSDLAAILRTAEGVISARLHGLLCARAAGVRAYAISSDSKLREFCRGGYV